MGAPVRPGVDIHLPRHLEGGQLARRRLPRPGGRGATALRRSPQAQARAAMKRFLVYLPVCVAIEMDDDDVDGVTATVADIEVDWDGTPWERRGNIWDTGAAEGTSHMGDEESVLWMVEEVAERAVARAVPDE